MLSSAAGTLDAAPVWSSSPKPESPGHWSKPGSIGLMLPYQKHAMMKKKKLKIPFLDSSGKQKKASIEAVHAQPAKPRNDKLVILANGAGADMNSDFMTFFHQGIGEHYRCLKFNFLYQSIGRKSPDSARILEDTWLSICQYAVDKLETSPGKIVLGGKSMGGRYATMIAPRTKAGKIVLLGYPLHPPGRKDKLRVDHLMEVKAKMLFCSGTRDSLADYALLQEQLSAIPRAALYTVPEGDHSFKVLKRSGLDQEKVMTDTLNAVLKFIR
jgi:predicted alpha/beta-hydrolase family hydrolase